jgi:hypothetical protein
MPLWPSYLHCFTGVKHNLQVIENNLTCLEQQWHFSISLWAAVLTHVIYVILGISSLFLLLFQVTHSCKDSTQEKNVIIRGLILISLCSVSILYSQSTTWRLQNSLLDQGLSPPNYILPWMPGKRRLWTWCLTLPGLAEEGLGPLSRPSSGLWWDAGVGKAGPTWHCCCSSWWTEDLFRWK